MDSKGASCTQRGHDQKFERRGEREVGHGQVIYLHQSLCLRPSDDRLILATILSLR